jgi:MoxR-like ATPase
MTESRAFSEAVVDRVERIVIGKRAPIELVTLALLCKGHVLIEDVPGPALTVWS